MKVQIGNIKKKSQKGCRKNLRKYEKIQEFFLKKNRKK